MTGAAHGRPQDARDTLVARLGRALRAADAVATGAAGWADAALAPMPDRGLAHDHVRLAGRGIVARLPKQSQMGLGAAENLAYQAACYTRAAVSGHAPRLIALLAPGADLPRGGLLVEEIAGRPARLPADLPAIAAALGRIHALPLPPAAARPPLADPADPLALLIAEIAAQAAHADAARVAPEIRALIADGLARLEALRARPARPARRLIAFDAHPGNFIIRPDGTAVLVDLEKCRYSAPPLDLAHATLYTSTTWDIDSHAVLDLDEVAGAYRVWEDACGGDAARLRPWLVPLRRAMWLWSLSWCAKWRALSAAAAASHGDGEDWSAANSDAALIAHVRDRVDHYLDPDTARRVAVECDALDDLLACAPSAA